MHVLRNFRVFLGPGTIWRPQNRKYITYCNAVRRGSSYGNRQHVQKNWVKIGYVISEMYSWTNESQYSAPPTSCGIIMNKYKRKQQRCLVLHAPIPASMCWNLAWKSRPHPPQFVPTRIGAMFNASPLAPVERNISKSPPPSSNLQYQRSRCNAAGKKSWLWQQKYRPRFACTCYARWSDSMNVANKIVMICTALWK